MVEVAGVEPASLKLSRKYTTSLVGLIRYVSVTDNFT